MKEKGGEGLKEELDVETAVLSQLSKPLVYSVDHEDDRSAVLVNPTSLHVDIQWRTGTVFFLREMFKKTRRFAAKTLKNNSQKRLKKIAASRQKTLKKTLKQTSGNFR